eukprot:TRINITY_DN13772_c0_g1_i1.p1 TRINITY_DN13772_c0_g1~~TRINITY_DN13772_c0_g1_i1.p1  ORF type:complete len:343 (+),score=60.01 TRINITY_DN13772_c0_g1_i1:28-1029(+)
MTHARVIESAEFIANNATHVSIPKDSIRNAAQQLVEMMKQKQYSSACWKQNELTPSVADENSLNWIFIIDTLNFCFWAKTPEELFAVTYKGKRYTGYWSLCACINRALDEGVALTDANFLANLQRETIEHIFRSDNGQAVPLLEKRLSVLREAGQVLQSKFQGSFRNCVAQANRSASKLVDLVVENFSSYRDQTEYKGKAVYFYKRAQILVADIWACFEGEGLGQFDDIDTITMFADYRVPQALRFFGLLEYSSELEKRLTEDPYLPSGDPLEVEIRGCSIWSVELLKRCIIESFNVKSVNCIILDFFLWDYAIEHKQEMTSIPIHKTSSVFY